MCLGGCTGLSKVNLPEGLTTIYAYAFEKCTSLVSIDLPDSITTMAARAFYNCEKLSEVKLSAGWTTVLDRSMNSSTYYSDSSNQYTSPFDGCSSLTKVTIPEGIKAIPKHAFRYLTTLKEVVLSEGVTSIGGYAFDGCTGLAEFELPENLTDIGSYAFNECIGLTSITIPSQIQSINGFVFRGCTGLSKVNLPEGLTTIYAYAFEKCTSLVSIDLPDSITTMAARAFYNCEKLSEVKLSAGWTTVLDRSMNSSTYYSDSSNQYTSPFDGCSSLTKVTIPEGIKAIPKHAFRYLTTLKEVVLSEGMTSIGVYAFDGCTALAKIWIDEVVTDIGNYAFQNCTNLTIHGVEGSYAQEYAEASNIPFSTELLVYPSVSIAGQVEDENGDGIPGVMVTLYDVTWKETQETLKTDETGKWNCAEAIIGHEYRVWFYHTEYSFDKNEYTMIIGEENIDFQTVIAKKKEAVLETEVEDFTYSVLNGTYCKITAYTGSDVAVRVPSEIDGYIVQSIGDNAFKGNTTLTTVVFPESIETIGSNVFNGCTNLTDVGLNHGLTNIGNNTFQGCTSLASITLPTSIQSIGDYAFSECTALSEVNLPEGLTTIYAHAFGNCTSLISIDLPGSIQSIGSYAFSECTALSEVNLSEGLTTIYAYAFQNCTSLERIDLPDSITTMAARAFYNCEKLSEVKLSAGWTTVLDRSMNSSTYYSDSSNQYTSPFDGCSSLTKVTMPEGIKAIPKHAFRYLTTLKEVVLSEGVTSIGGYAFDGCTGLAEIELPESLIEIGSYAFNGCTGLTSITIPSQIQSINGFVFRGCTGLSKVNLPEGLTTIYAYAFEKCTSLVSIDLPDSITTMAARAFYNCEKLSEVKLSAGWTTVLDRSMNSSTYYSDSSNQYTSPFDGCSSLTKVTIPEGIKAIPKHAFRYLTTLKEVVLSEGVTSIGGYAFDGCTGLAEFELPENLTDIGSYAFNECIGLTSITIPSQIQSINGFVFRGCTGLSKVNLPEGLTTIYAYAFEKCTSLVSIDLPDSITTMAARAFYNCEKLSEVKLSAGWTTVLDRSMNSSTYYSDSSNQYTSPFDGCSSLTKVTIPEGIKAIPKHAFRYLTTLKEVVLSEGVTSIGVYAFDGCSGLKTINLAEGITTIPDYAFQNCTSLGEVVLPTTVVSIGSYAYYNCIGLRTITMNKQLKSIGSYAFYGCDGVLSLVLNEGLETISRNSFSNCDNLKTVEIPSSVTSFGENVFDGCTKLTIYCYSGTQAHMVSEAEGYRIYLLDEHEHEYTTTVETAPTCTRGGSQILTCSICGYYYIDILEALGHTEGKWTLLRAPTCTVDGIRTLNCAVCKDEIDRVYIDAFGHTEGEWETISGSCIEGGIRVKYCIVCEGETQRESIPATGHMWGEWIVESEASVLTAGITARTCSICQEREEVVTEKITVDYTENNQYGIAHFVIVDATTLEPIPNVNIFISTENDGEAVLTADINGKLSQVLPVGNIKLSVYASGYQTRNISITIQSGENKIPTIGISSKNLVHGELTATEMTYEEMVDAGIDVNDPDSQHLYKYALVLEFVPEIDWLSIMYYWGGNGLPVVTDASASTDDDDGSDSDGSGSSDGTVYYEIINDDSGIGRGVKYTTTTGRVVSVYPVSERFFLIIYGEVHWLKDMYDVELLAINTSLTDTVENLVAELVLPEGLSLAKMVDGEQSLVQYMGSLAGGESKSVHWYVRGDEEGSYTLSATLKGSMLPFGDTFEYTYETQEPLKVYAGNAMHLTFYVPDSAFTGEDYTVRIELKNVSDKTLYNVRHSITGVDQYRVTNYSDGMKEIEEYPVSGGTSSIFIPEFRPGDVIDIETSTTIMFESELMDYKKEQAKNMLSSVEGLMQGFEALETGVGMMFDVGEWISTALEAMQNYLDNAIITSSEKEQMTNSIIRQLQGLRSELSGNPTAGKIRKVQELKDAGVWDEVQTIINNPSVLDDYSGKEIAKLSARLSAANAIQSEEFDIYNSVRKIIDLIPVRFQLINAWTATLEESTTVIPSTINITPVGPHYFGVDSVSNYIASLFKLYVLDEIADAIPINILSDKYMEDVGYYEALDYVRMTENRASLYNVTGTGSSSFKTWIEPAETSVYSISMDTETLDFELSIDNGTGTIDENGVLSFTGSGILSVTPRSQVPGVLCIEMEDGTVARYPIVVAEEHECSSEDWYIAIAPTDTMKGFRVKLCDICGEIIDMGELVSCFNHKFTDYTELQEPTMDATGVNVRTCIHCGCEEYVYEDAYALNGYIYCFESGTTVEEIIDFFNEKGMTVTMDDFNSTDWVATGYTLNYEGKQYQIVINGDTDGDAKVTIFDLLEVVDYIGGEAELTGAGLEAALSDIYESEPTISDVNSIVNQINDVE